MSVPFYAMFEYDATLYTARGVRAALNTTFRESLEFVRNSYWALKFTNEGARLYGFKARTKRYMIRKARKLGHQIPNVYTGDLKREMLSSQPKATYKGGSIVAKSHFPMTAERREELETILPGQRRYLVEEWLPKRYRELQQRPEFKDRVRQRKRF